MKSAAELGEQHDARLSVWTVGHSTRTAAELRAVLEAYELELVADVRRFPGSRRLPQFERETLAASLDAHGIAYCWIAELGGRRRPAPDSPNIAWRHPAFRAYADHVAGEEFAEGLFELLMLAPGLRTVVMCAEVLWWRCHRRLIADALTSLGVRVVHVRDETHAEEHRLTAPARLTTGGLDYTAAPNSPTAERGAPSRRSHGRSATGREPDDILHSSGRPLT